MKYQYDGSIIWQLNNELKQENEDVRLAKCRIMKIMDSCHQILYNTSSIVGKDAMMDIMKLLSVKFLESLFNDENSIVYKKLQELVNSGNILQRDIDRCLPFCKNISLLLESELVFDDWMVMIKKLLSKVLSNIFSEEDAIFKCKSESAIKDIINQVSELNTLFTETLSGEIYEFFINKYCIGEGFNS